MGVFKREKFDLFSKYRRDRFVDKTRTGPRPRPLHTPIPLGYLRVDFKTTLAAAWQNAGGPQAVIFAAPEETTLPPSSHSRRRASPDRERSQPSRSPRASARCLNDPEKVRGAPANMPCAVYYCCSLEVNYVKKERRIAVFRLRAGGISRRADALQASTALPETCLQQ